MKPMRKPLVTPHFPVAHRTCVSRKWGNHIAVPPNTCDVQNEVLRAAQLEWLLYVVNEKKKKERGRGL